MRNYRILFCLSMWFAMQATYYEILKIPPTATEKEIRTAYLREAKKMHPDKNLNKNAVFMFQTLGNAYATLKDPELRRQYDASLYNENFEFDQITACNNCIYVDISWFDQYAFFFFASCLKNSHQP